MIRVPLESSRRADRSKDVRRRSNKGRKHWWRTPPLSSGESLGPLGRLSCRRSMMVVAFVQAAALLLSARRMAAADLPLLPFAVVMPSRYTIAQHHRRRSRCTRNGSKLPKQQSRPSRVLHGNSCCIFVMHGAQAAHSCMPRILFSWSCGVLCSYTTAHSCPACAVTNRVTAVDGATWVRAPSVLSPHPTGDLPLLDGHRHHPGASHLPCREMFASGHGCSCLAVLSIAS